MNKPKCGDHEFEDLFKIACRTAFDAEAVYYHENPTTHPFSKEFKRKMKRLIDQTEHMTLSVSAYRKNKRKVAALIAAAILLATTTTVLTVEPLSGNRMEQIRCISGMLRMENYLD